MEQTNNYFLLVDNDFDGIEQSYISNKEYGKAKTYLAEADFVVNYFDRIKTSVNLEDDFDELMKTFRKTSFIKKLEDARDYFELCNQQWQQACRTSEGAIKSYSVEAKLRSSKNYLALTLKLLAQLKIH